MVPCLPYGSCSLKIYSQWCATTRSRHIVRGNCAFLPNSTYSDIDFVAWHWLWQLKMSLKMVNGENHILFCLLPTLPTDKMQKFSRSQLVSTSILETITSSSAHKEEKSIRFYLQSRVHFPSRVSCVSCAMCFNQPPRRSNWDLGT